MNYIKHLSVFYQKSNADKRLNTIHICLYHALFQAWNQNRFMNPFPLNRRQLLVFSKIGSNHTFYKYLHDLHDWGFIKYLPSKNPFYKSYVYIIEFESEDKDVNAQNEKGQSSAISQNIQLEIPKLRIDAKYEDVENVQKTVSCSPDAQQNPGGSKIDNQSLCISSSSPCASDEQIVCKSEISYDSKLSFTECIIAHDTDAEMHQYRCISAQATGADMHNILKLNNTNIKTRESVLNNAHTREDFQEIFLKKIEKEIIPDIFPEKEKRKKVAPKKEKEFVSPSLTDVVIFFLSEKYPETEARKFYYHYQANGWLVGGKTPMSDWQAASHNWMFKANQFETTRENINLSSEKDYGEPL